MRVKAEARGYSVEVDVPFSHLLLLVAVLSLLTADVLPNPDTSPHKQLASAFEKSSLDRNPCLIPSNITTGKIEANRYLEFPPVNTVIFPKDKLIPFLDYQGGMVVVGTKRPDGAITEARPLAEEFSVWFTQGPQKTFLERITISPSDRPGYVDIVHSCNPQSLPDRRELRNLTPRQALSDMRPVDWQRALPRSPGRHRRGRE